MRTKRQLDAGTIRANDAQTDKYAVLFCIGTTAEEQVCETWGKARIHNDGHKWNKRPLDAWSFGSRVIQNVTKVKLPAHYFRRSAALTNAPQL